MAVPVRFDLIADLGGKSSRLSAGLSRLFASAACTSQGWRVGFLTRTT